MVIDRNALEILFDEFNKQFLLNPPLGVREKGQGSALEQQRRNSEYLKSYHDQLKDFTIDHVKATLRSWTASNKWYPTPGELRRVAVDLYLDSMQYPQADACWLDVLRTRNYVLGYHPDKRPLPRFQSELAVAVVRELGWRTIVNASDSELPFVKNRFVKAHGMLVTRLDRWLMRPVAVQKWLLGIAKKEKPEISDLSTRFLLEGPDDAGRPA